MATTFAQLYSAALASAQSSAEDSTALDIAKNAVNEAYLSVCGDGIPWDFLEREGTWTTQAGADTYTYAAILTALGLSGAAIKEVIHLTDDTNGGRPLDSMSWGQLESLARSTQYQAGASPADAPHAWAKWHDRIRLYPEPDAAYELGTFLHLTPAALVADSDETLIPDAFARAVLVPYAAAIMLETEGGSEALNAANNLMARHERNYIRMRTSHGSAKAPTFNLVTPTATAEWDELDAFGWWGL